MQQCVYFGCISCLETILDNASYRMYYSKYNRFFSGCLRLNSTFHCTNTNKQLLQNKGVTLSFVVSNQCHSFLKECVSVTKTRDNHMQEMHLWSSLETFWIIFQYHLLKRSRRSVQPELYLASQCKKSGSRIVLLSYPTEKHKATYSLAINIKTFLRQISTGLTKHHHFRPAISLQKITWDPA